MKRIDRKLGNVKIKDTVSIYQFFRKCIIAADGVDLLTGIFCHADDLMEGFLSAESKISPGDIQTGQQKIRTAGGLGQIDDLTDMSGGNGGTGE